MTFPVPAGTGSGPAESSNLSSHTVNLPASISAGDLLMVFGCHASDPGTLSATGWASLGADLNGTNVGDSILWKVATGSEGATVTITSANATRSTWASVRITGADTSTAPVKGTAVTGSSASPDAPSLTPPWGALDTLWIAFCGMRTAAVTFTAPTGYNTAVALPSANVGAAYATRNVNASSEDPGVMAASASQSWVAQTIAIKPAGSVSSKHGFNMPMMGL